MEINFKNNVTVATTSPPPAVPVPASLGVSQISATSNLSLTVTVTPTAPLTTPTYAARQHHTAEPRMPRQTDAFSITSESTVFVQTNIIPSIPEPQAGPWGLTDNPLTEKRYLKKTELFGRKTQTSTPPSTAPDATPFTTPDATLATYEASAKQLKAMLAPDPVASTSGYRPTMSVTNLYEQTRPSESKRQAMSVTNLYEQTRSPGSKRQAMSTAEKPGNIVSTSALNADQPMRYFLKTQREIGNKQTPVNLGRPFLDYKGAQGKSMFPSLEQKATIASLVIAPDRNIQDIFKTIGINHEELVNHHRFSEIADIIVITDMIGYPINQIQKKIDYENSLTKRAPETDIDFRIIINRKFRGYLGIISRYIRPEVISALDRPDSKLQDLAISRQLGHLYLFSSPVYTMLQNYIDIRLEKTKPYTVITNTPLSDNYFNRLKLIIDTMKVGPLAIVGSSEVSYIKFDELPYQNKGLGFSKLHNWAAGKHSDRWLRMAASYCNYRLEEITTTADIDLSGWDGLTDDTLAKLLNLHYLGTSLTEEYDIENLRHISTIMSNVYPENENTENIDVFLKWVKDSALIEGSKDEIASMIFDEPKSNGLSLSMVAELADSLGNGRGELKHTRKSMGNYINTYCQQRLSDETRYPDIITKESIENKVNAIHSERQVEIQHSPSPASPESDDEVQIINVVHNTGRNQTNDEVMVIDTTADTKSGKPAKVIAPIESYDYILKFAAQKLDLNIVIYDDEGKYQGYYNTDNKFIHSETIPGGREYLALKPGYLLPDRGSSDPRYVNPQPFNTNHKLLLTLMTNSQKARTLGLTLKGIALNTFKLEQILVEEYYDTLAVPGTSKQP